MKKLLIFLFLIPLLVACAVPKETSFKEDLSEKTKQDEQWKNDEQKNLELHMQQAVKEFQDKMSEMQMSWNRTNYSPPDSTGKQYPTAVETGTMNNKTNEMAGKAQDTNVQYNLIEEKILSLERKIDTFMQQNRNIDEKTEPPWWQKALMALGIVFITWMGVKLYMIKGWK
nr:MAG TPA: Prokaryotic membrane lipoprotein lipid attachment site [Caudoviricetes sp.]